MQRKTQQRSAIRETLERAARPLTPQEILDGAQSEVPSLGIATVYRNLKALVEEEELVVVELPGSASRYEIPRIGHHHHFHCRRCDKVFEVDGCPGNLKSLAPAGFQPEGHEIILYGLCAGCAA